MNIKTNFHKLCEPEYSKFGGINLWIDYYNSYVSHKSYSEKDILKSVRANLNT